MPKAKRSQGGNESDSDDGGFLTRFHHLPTANAQEPVGIRYNRENAFSSSYILTTSRTVITVSMIFALLESLLYGLSTLAIYDELDSIIQIISVAIFIIFIGGEGVRIYILCRWWGISPRSDIEPNRAYRETKRCILTSTFLILFIIYPICFVVFFFIYSLGSLRSFQVPASFLLFVIVAMFDFVLFIPFFACPTAICAACFWKRIVRRHERGREYLRGSES